LIDIHQNWGFLATWWLHGGYMTAPCSQHSRSNQHGTTEKE
jgi:hypothetical protein